jgi:hypothetical protein
MDRQEAEHFLEDWGTAVHEAGHAVMQLWHPEAERVLTSVEIFDRTASRRTLGTTRHDGVCSNMMTVAGHFAELRWGNGRRRGQMFCGSDGDFLDMVRSAARSRHWCKEFHYRDGDVPRIKKVDRIEARKVWNLNMRKLAALVKRDPSFERKVKAVAAALLDKRKLLGHEVLEIMATA